MFVRDAWVSQRLISKVLQLPVRSPSPSPPITDSSKRFQALLSSLLLSHTTKRLKSSNIMYRTTLRHKRKRRKPIAERPARKDTLEESSIGGGRSEFVTRRFLFVGQKFRSMDLGCFSLF